VPESFPDDPAIARPAAAPALTIHDFHDGRFRRLFAGREDEKGGRIGRPRDARKAPLYTTPNTGYTNWTLGSLVVLSVDDPYTIALPDETETST
jgi:hypothetical protein